MTVVAAGAQYRHRTLARAVGRFRRSQRVDVRRRHRNRGRELSSGMSLSGGRLLARWCPASPCGGTKSIVLPSGLAVTRMSSVPGECSGDQLVHLVGNHCVPQLPVGRFCYDPATASGVSGSSPSTGMQAPLRWVTALARPLSQLRHLGPSARQHFARRHRDRIGNQIAATPHEPGHPCTGEPGHVVDRGQRPPARG